MANEKEYIYPDYDSTIMSIYIDTNEPYKNYWKDSEDFVLESFKNLIQQKEIKSILDVGSGDGGKILRYKDYFNDITLLDPDKKQLEFAKENFESSKKIKYINSCLLDSKLSKNKYDIIFCSQSIQFVLPEKLEKFVNKLYKSLKIGGYLVLITSKSDNDDNYYRKMFIDYNKIRVKNISEEKYYNLLNSDEYVICEHVFSIKYLIKLFSKFNLLELKIFHILDKKKLLDKIVFRDKFYNLLPFKKKYGRDVYMLFQK